MKDAIDFSVQSFAWKTNLKSQSLDSENSTGLRRKHPTLLVVVVVVVVVVVSGQSFKSKAQSSEPFTAFRAPTRGSAAEMTRKKRESGSDGPEGKRQKTTGLGGTSGKG